MSITTRVYDRGGRLWCTGGKWFPAARAASPKAAAAKEAKGYKATHAVIDAEHRQIGLFDLSTAPLRPGWRRPCYSAALAVRDALASDAHHAFAAFELGDGAYYLVAIVNRRLLPDGDQLLNTAEAARAAYDAWQRAREWPNAVRIAPQSWGIADTFEAALSPHLDSAEPPKATALTRPSALTAWHYAAMAAAAYAAYTLIEPVLFPPPPKPKPVATPAATAVWETIPDTVQPLANTLAWCSPTAFALRRNAPVGWPAAEIKCTGQGATARYVRSAEAPYRYVLTQSGLTPSSDSSSADRSVPAPLLPSSPLTAEDLPRADTVTAHLRDTTGTLRANLSVTERPPQLTGDKSKAPPAPKWVRMEWTFQTVAPETMWRSQIVRIPATSLTAITYTSTTVTIEGVTYAQR